MNNNLSKEREDLTVAEKSIRDANAKLDMLKIVEDVSIIIKILLYFIFSIELFFLKKNKIK